MTDLRKAAEMALEALERGTTGLAIRAIPALRQALADQKLADAFAEDFPNTWGKKKHTAPPSKPWVSLTAEEIAKAANICGGDPMKEFARAIEAALRSKNI